MTLLALRAATEGCRCRVHRTLQCWSVLPTSCAWLGLGIGLGLGLGLALALGLALGLGLGLGQGLGMG